VHITYRQTDISGEDFIDLSVKRKATMNKIILLLFILWFSTLQAFAQSAPSTIRQPEGIQGGVPDQAVPSNEFVTGISSGTFTHARPSCSTLENSGSACAANTTDFDPAGSAATVQGNFDTFAASLPSTYDPYGAAAARITSSTSSPSNPCTGLQGNFWRKLDGSGNFVDLYQCDCEGADNATNCVWHSNVTPVTAPLAMSSGNLILDILGLTEQTTPTNAYMIPAEKIADGTYAKINPVNIKPNACTLADTATALATNGSNCSAGNYPLGVDANGNAESCTAVPLAVEVFTWVVQVTSSTAGVKYMPTASVTEQSSDATNSSAVYVITRTGTLKNLYCNIAQGASSTNNITFVARYDAADTAITYNQTTNGTGSNTSNTVAVTAGHLLSVSYTSATASVNYGFIKCTIEVNFAN